MVPLLFLCEMGDILLPIPTHSRVRSTGMYDSKQHHQSRTPVYRSWNMAIQRCINPNNPGYKNYGGRGIGMCKHWRYSFEQFIKDMGPRPDGSSIERVNNDLGYLCPLCHPPVGNCIWANRHVQRVNQRPKSFKAVKVRTPRGEIMKAWCDKQTDAYKLARNANARAVAGDALGEWRANKTTECLRCGYKWAKITKHRSRICPNCTSSKWDVPPPLSEQTSENNLVTPS